MRVSLAVALLLSSAGALAAQSSGRSDMPDGPQVVTTAWVAEHTSDPRVRLIEITMTDSATATIPGARQLPYARLVVREGGLSTQLPPADTLRARFAALGVSDGDLVVVFAHQGPMATRALFSLAALSHARYAYLDGGLARWRAEGRPVAPPAPVPAPGRMSAQPPRDVVASADWMLGRLGKPGTGFIDTRTTGEYNGSGNRSGMPSAGHLAGARQLEWEDLFADSAITLKPRAELERLFAERVRAGDQVATYCWVGYRASATWFIAHWLGYDARLFDGSYQEWQLRNLPTVAGGTP